MCAIIDANVRDQVFGASRPKAGRYLFDQLNSDKKNLKLVVGGKLLQELSKSRAFNTWLQTALLFGRAQSFPDQEVAVATKEFQELDACRSNDAHVLALARVSGARLLFTNDQDLMDDFRDPKLVEGIRGKVYTTRLHEHVTSTHRNLLRRPDLCGT